MLVKVACLCYSGSMDFFQIVFHFKSKLVEKATEQISSKTKLILFENQIQTASTSPCRIYVTDFVSLIYNLKAVL